jgi:hypothetical protein
VVFGEVQNAVNNTVVVHLNEVALTDLLIVGDKSFAMGAAYRQDVTATDFFAVWVWD